MSIRDLSRRVRSVALAIECTAALAAASLRVAITSRHRLVAGFGPVRAADQRPRGTPPPPITDPAARAEYHAGIRIGRMVERVAKVLPWKPTCLRQALATRWILRRRGIPNVMHLGVANAQEMDAHAWVTVHKWSVVGRGPGQFVPVASFDG